MYAASPKRLLSFQLGKESEKGEVRGIGKKMEVDKRVCPSNPSCIRQMEMGRPVGRLVVWDLSRFRKRSEKYILKAIGKQNENFLSLLKLGMLCYYAI